MRTSYLGRISIAIICLDYADTLIGSKIIKTF